MTLAGAQERSEKRGKEDCRYLSRETRFIQQVDETDSTEGGATARGEERRSSNPRAGVDDKNGILRRSSSSLSLWPSIHHLCSSIFLHWEQEVTLSGDQKGKGKGGGAIGFTPY